MDRRAKLAAEMTHLAPIQSERPLPEWWNQLNMLQKLSMAPVPMVSDVAGLLGDMQMYREQPDTRSAGNYAATAAGLLPFVPSAFGMVKPRRLEKGLKGSADYVYHATNAERLAEIAESGRLRTHKPWDFTEQDMWPDGSTQKRAYFGAAPEHLWQFAPEEGVPVVLRTKRGPAFKRETTGDIYTEKAIKADLLEYLGEDDQWHKLTDLRGRD